MKIEMLIAKRIEQKQIKAKVQMATVIIVNQEDGMVMPTRKHNQKISVKKVRQKIRYIYLMTAW